MGVEEENEPTVADVDDDEDDDDLPDLEESKDGDDDGTGAGKGGKQNRSEKKSRKAIQKLGMKSVPGIFRVTVRKNKNILFVINKPDVYKSPASDTYVIVGEAKIEDLNASAQSTAAQNLTQAASDPFAAGEQGMRGNDKPVLQRIEEVDEEGDADAGGFTAAEQDIDLVSQQVSCSRAKAIRALKECNNDVVEAIMCLSE
eukprot:TRINITY_DN39380_c0_g1_i1.p1 TRINITY_DN39380_c0_g1~~TRINITY_DN39380_c0_g1_i1.p1  ORF type:complete len:201 (-),score=38.77 TRINITY_DN39380_c0_g1_i1:127-729(-)